MQIRLQGVYAVSTGLFEGDLDAWMRRLFRFTLVRCGRLAYAGRTRLRGIFWFIGFFCFPMHAFHLSSHSVPSAADSSSTAGEAGRFQVRLLGADELGLLWGIDRSEHIKGLYELRDGRLNLQPADIDLQGWPEGDQEKYQPEHEDALGRGAWVLGVFEEHRLVAAVGLDSLPLGPQGDWRQLFFLHVSQSMRGEGLGRWLLEQAKQQARIRGAKALYVSATPSVRTVDFYLAQGFVLAPEPDPRLYELDPEDIHLLHHLP